MVAHRNDLTICVLIVIFPLLWVVDKQPAELQGEPPDAQVAMKPLQPNLAEQGPAVRLKSELIEVRAVVTDPRGRIVGDLKQEDFELLEDGHPQEIVLFSVERIGGVAPDGAVSDQRGDPSTRHVHPPEPPARTIVLFVDTLHLSSSSLLRLRPALKRFVDEQISEQDVVSLVTSTGSLGLLEQFTQDRRVLGYAIAKLMPWREEGFLMPYLAAMVDRGDPDASRVAAAILRAEEGIPANPMYVSGRAQEILSQAAMKRKVMLSTLKAVAERLAEMPGQRMVIFISDGFTLWDVGGSHETSELQSVISRAVRSGVIIYSLDAKGLESDPLFDASRPSLATDSNVYRYISASIRDLENGMSALASDTGGEAFFNTNDLNGALRKALDNNSVYYVLAYYPPTEQEDKRFRHITVRVKNHPEYNVRAQKGYLPLEVKKDDPAPTPRQRLFQAIAAPLPLMTLGVTASAEFLESETDDG